MKVFIAVPSLETVPALFCQSLALLQRAGDTLIGFEVGSLVYNAQKQPCTPGNKGGSALCSLAGFGHGFRSGFTSENVKSLC